MVPPGRQRLGFARVGRAHDHGSVGRNGGAAVTFFDYGGGERRPEPDRQVFLPEASEQDWSDLLRSATVRRLGAGETLVEPGVGTRSLFLVLAGQFEVLAPAGRKWRRLAVIGAGSVAGEIAFFDGGPRTALVRALSESSAAELTAEAFAALSRIRPELALAVAMEVGRLLAQTVRQREGGG
jgi:CRP-like cAMP-binding protein